MAHLYELTQQKVTDWRRHGYPTEKYPAIAEMLDHAALPETDTLRYLRAAQLRAMETYWHRCLVQGTPHIFDAYGSKVRQVLPPPASLGPGAARAPGPQDPL